MPEPLKRQKLILVEGKDEVNFFMALAEYLGYVDVEVRSFDGVRNLRGMLMAIKSVEGFERLRSLGIIRDAEGNGVAALQSIRDALGNAGFVVPIASLRPAGQNPAVTILVNPHERPAGRFDDVCSESVADQPVMACVNQFIDCLKALGPGVLTKEWKTRLHAYIAAQDRPEVSLGVAAKCGYFPLGHAAFAACRRLFELVENA